MSMDLEGMIFSVSLEKPTTVVINIKWGGPELRVSATINFTRGEVCRATTLPATRSRMDEFVIIGLCPGGLLCVPAKICDTSDLRLCDLDSNRKERSKKEKSYRTRGTERGCPDMS